VHTPLIQLSTCVQPLPSLQAVPSGACGFVHAPEAGSQTPRWHWSLAVHVTGLVPVQVPFWQLSVCVQALPSSQLVPSPFAGLLHWPVVMSHVPALWH
jgi:hypothetical protein